MMSEEEQLNQLFISLEPYLPHAGETEELFRPAARVFADVVDNIEAAEDGLRIDTAGTKAELDQRGHAAGISTNDDETLEEYRNRVRFNYNEKTSAGTPDEIIKYAHNLLNVPEESIVLENYSDKRRFSLRVPATSISQSVSSASAAGSLLGDVTASTCTLDVIGTGTLGYITEYQYNNNEYDTSTGYATLDSDGNITSGGTYSANYS